MPRRAIPETRKILYNVYLSKEQIEALTEIGKREHKYTAECVREALTEYINKHTEETK